MNGSEWIFTRRKRPFRQPEWSARCVAANGAKIARLNQWYSRRIDAERAVELAQIADVKKSE